jgi:hypothetical protein
VGSQSCQIFFDRHVQREGAVELVHLSVQINSLD